MGVPAIGFSITDFPDTFAHLANGLPPGFYKAGRRKHRGRSVMAHVASPPVPGLLLNALAKHWWLLLLRGICAILFGALTFVWPRITLLTLVLLYGSYALADGVLALAAGVLGVAEAVMGGAPAARWWLALVGLLGIAVGILTFAWPGITALVLLLFIAGWAIATGVLQIVGAIRLRKEIDNEWLLIASG